MENPAQPEAQPQINPQASEKFAIASIPKKLRAWNTKNYLIIFLLAMAAYSIYSSHFYGAVLQILIAVGVAVAEDLLIAFASEAKLPRISSLTLGDGKGEKFYFPSSSIVTGLFVGTLLPVGVPFYVVVVTAFIAIISKNFLKISGRHIFNPASFGLVLAVFIFGTSHAWWAATSLPLIAVFGIFIAWKQKRYSTTPAYLLAYVLLSVVVLALLQKPIRLYPDLIDESILFFAFFMLTEPMTSPFSEKSRAVYGVIAGAAGVLLLNFSPIQTLAAVNVLLGLLIANLFVPILNKRIK